MSKIHFECSTTAQSSVMSSPRESSHGPRVHPKPSSTWQRFLLALLLLCVCRSVLNSLGRSCLPNFRH